MPKPKQEPTWQPLSQLPMIAYMIDGMTDSAEEQLVNMGQAEERPHVLDNGSSHQRQPASGNRPSRSAARTVAHADR